MDSAVVKSVGRVFEVLELFDRGREPMTATQVGRHLSYPQSSTLALLKSMVKLGYLAFDRGEHTYFPTMRVALLGQWLENSLYGEGHLFAMLEEICEATGETVALSCQNDLAMQFMQIRTGSKPITLNIQPGTLAPLFHSTIGLVALSDKSDQDIVKLAERYNRKVRPPEKKADLPAVLQRVRKVRRAGFGVGYDMYVPSVAALAWVLPPRVGKRSVVLSVAGPSQRVKEEEADIIRIVRSVTVRHLPR
jgi:DNA-binding IclR family transcriptional regulator